MILRRLDGTYCLSSPDGEFGRDVSKKIGDEILRRAIGKDEADKCIRENRYVWVG